MKKGLKSTSMIVDVLVSGNILFNSRVSKYEQRKYIAKLTVVTMNASWD